MVFPAIDTPFSAGIFNCHVVLDLPKKKSLNVALADEKNLLHTHLPSGPPIIKHSNGTKKDILNVKFVYICEQTGDVPLPVRVRLADIIPRVTHSSHWNRGDITIDVRQTWYDYLFQPADGENIQDFWGLLVMVRNAEKLRVRVTYLISPYFLRVHLCLRMATTMVVSLWVVITTKLKGHR